ncbi:MAG: hypothetical protein ACI8QF_000679 [Limisphaerales bacterium]|jgi:hypothetical protein
MPGMEAAPIEKEAMNLSEAQRALLADRLLQTIGIEDEARVKRWGDESERRLKAIEEGRLPTDDGAAVLERLGVKTKR